MFSSLGWDPEVPAGYQDADIEMRELEERAAEMTDHTKCRECKTFFPASMVDRRGVCDYCAGRTEE